MIFLKLIRLYRSVIICIILTVSTIPNSWCGSDVGYLDKIAKKCLNRKLNAAELKVWENNQINQENIEPFVDWLIWHEEFIQEVLVVMRFQILKGITFSDIVNRIDELEVLSIVLPLEIDDEIEKQNYAEERQRIFQVYSLEDDLIAKNIRFEEIYSRMFFSDFYEIQNMGYDNFITSTFQYCFGRTPTVHEKYNSIKMLNNEQGNLFYKEGNSKQDYIQIILNNDNFREYQVKYWYFFFNNEYPSSEVEQGILMDLKSKHQNVSISTIIKHIISYHLKL